MFFLICAIFLLSSVLPFFLKKEKQIRDASVWSASAAFLSVSYFSFGIVFDGKIFSNLFILADPFSALIGFLISFVYLSATLVSHRYIGYEYREGVLNFSRLRIYFSLLHAFTFSMILAIFSNNSILMWIFLESTTLFSTFLVGLYKKRTSVEAAWKYTVLCSTGITLGLIGVLLISYAAYSVGMGSGYEIFTLTFLKEISRELPQEIIKCAFIFVFIGFGTKVGLVPMHTWLPDAHSKAPSPVSALFSGILLNVAMALIIRFKVIADYSLGNHIWTGNLFLFFGVASIIFPALALLIQNNYKRMLAYSSIEHMGIISLAMAFPPLGTIGSVMHMIGHTFAKSALFFGAGEFMLRWKTTKIEKIKNLIEEAPFSGNLFLAGILGIIAVPTSLLFASEYLIFAQMFSVNRILAVIVLLAISLIAFSMLRLSLLLTYGQTDGTRKEKVKKENWNITHSVMAFQLILVFGLIFALTSQGGMEFVAKIAEQIN